MKIKSFTDKNGKKVYSVRTPPGVKLTSEDINRIAETLANKIKRDENGK
jgi:hypothetical protein